MSDPNDNLQLGGAPPPLSPIGGPSLADEEKAMRGGKGGMIAGMIITGVLIVGAVVIILFGGDGNDSYRTFGQNINGLDSEKFDPFWSCAFQGGFEAESNQQLQEAIHQRAARGQERYAAMVRDDCMQKLEELEPGLTSLIPPEDMVEDLHDLETSVRDLRGGWSDFIAHLDGLEGDYDPEAAGESVGRITKGWFDYRTTHSRLNATLREKLEE